MVLWHSTRKDLTILVGQSWTTIVPRVTFNTGLKCRSGLYQLLLEMSFPGCILGSKEYGTNGKRNYNFSHFSQTVRYWFRQHKNKYNLFFSLQFGVLTAKPIGSSVYDNQCWMPTSFICKSYDGFSHRSFNESGKHITQIMHSFLVESDSEQVKIISKTLIAVILQIFFFSLISNNNTHLKRRATRGEEPKTKRKNKKEEKSQGTSAMYPLTTKSHN